LKNKFLVGLILVLVLVQVSAVNCGMLEIEAYDVDIEAGHEKTVSFVVNNFASERFYIDRVNAFDYASGIQVEEQSWADVALAGDQAALRIDIKASDNAEGAKDATIEIKGHFLGGKECTYSNVNEEFTVNVFKETVRRISADCEGFSLYSIGDKYIDGSGELEFIAENKSGKDATILLESDDVELSENIFPVRAGVEETFKTIIRSSKDRAEIVYRIELDGCGISTKRTVVYSSIAVEEEEEEFVELDVVVSADVSRDENGFLVGVTIFNPNNSPTAGELRVDVPENFDVFGEGFAELDPNSSVIAELRIVPPKDFSGKANALIVFDGKIVESIELEAPESSFNPLGAAFISLSSGALFIGLLVIVIVIVLMIAARPHKQQFEPWLERNIESK